VTATLLLDAPYQAISYPFSVRTDLEEPARVIPELLAPFASSDVPTAPARAVYRLTRDPGGDGQNPFTVFVSGEVIARTATALGLVDETLWHVNREAIARAEGFVAVHASAASRGDRGVVLPASQDSGKSTTVAGLIRAGFAYMTDEAALLDLRSAQLHPYPKPLWLAPPSVLALEGLRDRVLPEYRDLGRIRTYVRPSDLGGSIPSPPCDVRLVVSPRYQPAAPTTLEAMTQAGTLMCLAENAFNLRELGAAGLDPLKTVVERARGYRLTFSSLREAVGSIVELVDALPEH
jgi:hypothetical protein